MQRLWSACIVLLLLLVACQSARGHKRGEFRPSDFQVFSPNQPQQVHIALESNVSQIAIQWVTFQGSTSVLHPLVIPQLTFSHLSRRTDRGEVRHAARHLHKHSSGRHHHVLANWLERYVALLPHSGSCADGSSYASQASSTMWS